jgi:hypothetical protein
VEPTTRASGGVGKEKATGSSAAATNRYFQALTEHCDEGSLHYACPPLVLHGPPGVGKSAILSNWLAQQRALREEAAGPLLSHGGEGNTIAAAATTTATTAMPTGVTSSRRMACLTRRAFVFWHAAGCSRTSCLTTHLLRRLQTELRAFFQLKKEVAADDERLRWDLPAFLELAARKVK